jgi:hypothetical protein
MPLFKACFWPKIEAILQKNGDPTKNISHFFSRFSCFPGFFHLQAIAFQRQAPLQPLPKKSCPKHYRRFFVRSGMCHNRRVIVEMTCRNEGCERWTAVKRQPALRAKRFGLRNDSSAFGQSVVHSQAPPKPKNCDQIRPNPSKSE